MAEGNHSENGGGTAAETTGAKKRRAFAVPVLCVLLACVALVFLFRDTIAPNVKLKRAEGLAAAGEYERAYALLNGLNVKNSGELAAECLYRIQRERLGAVTVGSVIRFGSFEQDGDPKNGAEEIEWIVLAAEGTRALVVSRYGLEPRVFNDEKNLYAVITWGNCQLRTWLNGTFCQTAFGAGHLGMILPSEVPAEKNPDADVRPGQDTKDRVFLLSIGEARRYFDSDGARQCFGTPWCDARGADRGENGACRWWLRSTGVVASSTAVVTETGQVFTNGFSTGHVPHPVVRPAMWIELG